MQGKAVHTAEANVHWHMQYVQMQVYYAKSCIHAAIARMASCVCLSTG